MWFHNSHNRSGKGKQPSQLLYGKSKHNRVHTTRPGKFELLDDDTVGEGSMFTSPDAVTTTGRSEAATARTCTSGRNLLDVADIEDQLDAFKRNVRLGIGNSSPNESYSQQRNKETPLKSSEEKNRLSTPAKHNRTFTRFEPVRETPSKKIQPILDVYASMTDTPRTSNVVESSTTEEPANKTVLTSSKSSLASILRPRTASEDSSKRGSSSKLRFESDVKSSSSPSPSPSPPKAPFVLPEHNSKSPRAKDNSSFCSDNSEFSPLVGLKLLSSEREDEDDNTLPAESISPTGVQDADLVNGSIRGVMRLTEDGLKAHERKTFREPKKTSDKLLVIKQEQAERQWYRHRRRQRESEFNNNSGLPPRKFQEAKPTVDQSSRKNDTNCIKKRSSILSIFKQNNSGAAEKVLEEECVDGVQENKMKQEELKEFKSIETKRQEYLARQRALEQRPPGVIDKNAKRLEINDANHEMSTMSSTKSGMLPPCVVCGLGTRSHIAAPCMHYAFCEACVTDGLGESCPVCSTKNVTFVPVAV